MIFIKVLLPILMFVLGTCLASFGNVLVCRYPHWSFKDKDAHSKCENCKHQLAWYDLFPLISYIALKGKCRYCKKPIPISYFLIELFSGLMFLGTYLLYTYVYPDFTFVFEITPIRAINFITYSLTLLILLCSALIDRKFKEAPLSFSLAILFLSLLNWGVKFAITKDYSLIQVLGFGVPFVLFALIYLFFTFVKKVEPIGITDIIVYCSLGLLMGIYNFIIILIVSSLTCSIRESIKIKKTGKKEQIPFLPYIFIGLAVAVFLGELIIKGYLMLIGVN